MSGHLLTGFSAMRPPHAIAHAETLRWLAEAHGQAEATLEGLDPGKRDAFAAKIARVLRRCACPPEKIAMRGVSVSQTESWHDSVLYDVARNPHGQGSGARSQLFSAICDAYFHTAYADVHEPPADLIHVTCTGYVSPNGAQKLVSRRDWGAMTRVTSAYHMGCYASVPAVRIAAGFLVYASRGQRVDIAHTELCSLHLDPADHRIEQLVVQSLFADGLIRYSLVHDEPRRAGLRILALHEQMLPDSTDSMGWTVSDWGMKMNLARDVPDRVASALRGFVIELYRRAGLDVGRLRDSIVAVHPGGPKIIDRVRDKLELAEPQVAASRGVLFDYGNMSSATLPHIWMRLLDDPSIRPGTLIPSLAFGPGLTVCGALFEKA
jgi:predicted naringenin-chalcone synthase